MLAVVVALVASGCQTPGGAPGKVATPPPRPPSTAGLVLASCYRLNGSESELRVLVYRDGPLAAVGHNHVLVSHALDGALAVTDPVAESRLELVLPVGSLDVDPPAARVEEGPDFAAAVSDEARAGTRKNLLGTGVLDADAYPEVRVRLAGILGPLWSSDATLDLVVRDTVARKVVTVAVVETASGASAASSFTVTHAELGLTPFSALGGGLRVAEDIRVRVKLEFRRAEASDVDACLGLVPSA